MVQTIWFHIMRQFRSGSSSVNIRKTWQVPSVMHTDLPFIRPGSSPWTLLSDVEMSNMQSQSNAKQFQWKPFILICFKFVKICLTSWHINCRGAQIALTSLHIRHHNLHSPFSYLKWGWWDKGQDDSSCMSFSKIYPETSQILLWMDFSIKRVFTICLF